MKPELQRLLNSLGDIRAMSNTWNINHGRIDAIIDFMKDEILSLQKQSEDEGLPVNKFVEKYSQELLKTANEFAALDAAFRMTFRPKGQEFRDKEVVLSLCVRPQTDEE